MNAYVLNFNEAIVFADECDHPHAKELYKQSRSIVGAFLIANAEDIVAYEAQESEESAYGLGSCAFAFGIAITFNDKPEDFANFPKLQAYADRVRAEWEAK